MTTPPKVAFIVPYRFVPPSNGGHRAAYGFAEFLSRKVSLTVISTDNNEANTPFELIPLFKDVPAKYLLPSVARKIVHILMDRGIEQCILHQPFIASWLLAYVKPRGIKLGIYVQNIEFQRFKSLNKWWWPLMRLFEKEVFKRSDFLFFISPNDWESARLLFDIQDKICALANYGTSLKALPTNRAIVEQQIRDSLQLKPDDKIFLFFGPQSYRPNLEAVNIIESEIAPYLRAKAPFNYKILICGGGLPAERQAIFERYEDIQYLGFVEKIEDYVVASDLVLNPILSGGGVKTKIIEAIALGTTVISFSTGAIGMDRIASGKKLVIVEDMDIPSFANAIIEQGEKAYIRTPASFYDHYYWGNTILPATAILNKGQF